PEEIWPLFVLRSQQRSGAFTPLRRRVEGDGGELVDTNLGQLVEAVRDRALVADDRGVLGSGVPLAVEHGAVGRQDSVHLELFGGASARGRDVVGDGYW